MGRLTDDMTRLVGEIQAARDDRGWLLRDLKHATVEMRRAVAHLRSSFAADLAGARAAWFGAPASVTPTEQRLKAKRDAEERAKRDAEVRAKLDAEERARHDAEARARHDAEAQAKRDAEAQAKRDAEAQAKRDAEARAKRDAEARAKRDAEARAKRRAPKAKRPARHKARTVHKAGGRHGSR